MMEDAAVVVKLGEGRVDPRGVHGVGEAIGEAVIRRGDCQGRDRLDEEAASELPRS
jgi:hypothetical protein